MNLIDDLHQKRRIFDSLPWAFLIQKCNSSWRTNEKKKKHFWVRQHCLLLPLSFISDVRACWRDRVPSSCTEQAAGSNFRNAGKESALLCCFKWRNEFLSSKSIATLFQDIFFSPLSLLFSVADMSTARHSRKRKVETPAAVKFFPVLLALLIVNYQIRYLLWCVLVGQWSTVQ